MQVIEFGTVFGAALAGLVAGAYVTVLVPRAVGEEPLFRPWPRLPWPGGELSRLGAGLVALTTATFVAIALRLGASPLLPAYLYLGAVSVVLAVIDVCSRRLPDAITLPSYAVGVLSLGAAAPLVERGRSHFVSALVGMAGLCLFYLALLVAARVIYRDGDAMGLGDVKLAGILGLYLGWFGAGVLVVGAFLGYLFGGVYGLAAIATRRATRTTSIPFGPFMVAGALLGVLVGERLAGLYLSW